MILSIIRNRGNVSKGEIQKFYDAGFTQRHLLEIILSLSLTLIILSKQL